MKANEKHVSENISFFAADIARPWPFADAFADLVVCNLVLEHIDDLCFVFSEAYRSLREGGSFFVCELHPFRQYQGTKARFQEAQGTTMIQAFVHNLSDFLSSAEMNDLTLRSCREWWHEQDQGKPPRLVSFMFHK